MNNSNDNSVKGTMKISGPTKGHPARLARLGYKTEELGGEILRVYGSEFVAEVDLTVNPGKTLRDITDEKRLMTYATVGTIVTKEGVTKKLKAVAFCQALGALCARVGIPVNLSCLVVHPEGGSAGKVAEATSEAPSWASEARDEAWESFF